MRSNRGREGERRRENPRTGTEAYSTVTRTYLTTYHRILDDMIRGMTEAHLTDSISQNFIVRMLPHHRAGVAMAENLLRYTSWTALEAFASRIVTTQTEWIADLTAALSRCGEGEEAPCSSAADLTLYERLYAVTGRRMFAHMRSAPLDNRLNADFLRTLIPHHEGTLAMVQDVSRFAICPALSPVTETMLTVTERMLREAEQFLREAPSV